MKWMKKILYGILGLLSLISLFIIICAFQPKLADQVSDFLYQTLGKGKHAGQEGMQPDAAGKAKENNNRDEIGGSDDSRSHVMDGSEKAEKDDEADQGMDQSLVSGYTPPKRSDIDMPKEVEGRSGYLPVQEDMEEIDEDEAEGLRQFYTYGETGEGLSFDTEYYPYYGMLSPKEQSLYRQIYANAAALNGIFNPVEPASQRELHNTFLAVFNDHPELFWLDCAYGGKFAGNGECVWISLQFNDLVDDLERAKYEFEAAAEEILAGAQGSDYEKELYVHDALSDRIEYDLQAPLNQSAYSALVNDRTVCAGYARSLQYLMTRLGVPCYYCTGFAGENHAWNIIRLDGEYYNVDTTWDDTTPNTYDYFNKTDHDFASTHKREDLSVYLPPCNGIKYGNLERNEAVEETGIDSRRSLEDAGFSEEDVLYGLDEYYDNCYHQIMGQNGSARFENVVDSEGLWFDCYQAYEDNSYCAGYMDKVLAELQAEGCEVDIEAESLRDGRVLLRHNIRFF